MDKNLVKKLKNFKLGQDFTFKKSRESNVTTAWGVDWDELYIARDLLQNFYDSNKNRVHEISIETMSNNTVVITSPGTFNIQRLFYLGSEKSSEDIGKYGEGFKAAAVCLLRDYNITPIAASGSDIYVIRLSEKPVPGTDMYPLIYDYYISNSSTEATKLILENCSPELATTLKNGLSSFFYKENHPIVGDYLTNGNRRRIEVYHSKDGKGYIFFEKLLRAELGDDLPLIFVFNYPYVKIKKFIGKDRDRRTFSTQSDLKIFYSEMSFDGYEAKELLEATKSKLWGKGRGHEIFHYIYGYDIRNYYAEELFGDQFYAKSPKSSKDLIEKTKIEEIENNWKNENRISLPSYFTKFGVISAEKCLEEMKEAADAERKKQEKREPTKTEWSGINLCKEIMEIIAPEVKYIFDNDKTSYTLGKTEFILGELKKGRSYKSREVYLSSKLFVQEFPVFFATFIHEHAHIFGYDGSRGFTDALTNILEMTLAHKALFDDYINRWENIRKKILSERNRKKVVKLDRSAIIDRISEERIRKFIKGLPELLVENLIKEEKRREFVTLLNLITEIKKKELVTLLDLIIETKRQNESYQEN